MSKTDLSSDKNQSESRAEDGAAHKQPAEERPKEIGGRKGPDPTRYGDWEKGGRCIDF
jgi:hypothetical protein